MRATIARGATLFLSLAFTACACAADDDQIALDAAIAELKRLRVLVFADEEHGGVRADGAYSGVSSADLALFQQIPDLRILDLRGTGVKDAGLEHLAGLTDLRELNLDHTQIVGEGLVHLKQMQSLVGLYLAYTNVDDASVAHLAGLKSLVRLNLCNTKVTDNVLPVLIPLKQLQEVGARFTGITQAAAEQHEKATSTDISVGNDSTLFADDELVLAGYPGWNSEFEKASQVALSRLNADVEAAPQDAKPLVRRSHHHLYVGSLDKALADLNQALGLDPNCVDALLGRAHLLRLDDREDQALQDLNKAIEIAPDDATLYLERAYIETDSAKMHADYAKAIELRPGRSVAWLERGLGYAHENNLEEARKCFDEAIRLAPLSIKALRNRALLFEQQGDYALAAADLNEATRIKPTDVGVLLRLADLLTTCPDGTIRNGERASGLAWDACQLTKHRDAYCLEKLAAASAEMGEFAEAATYQQEAIDLAQGEEKDRNRRAKAVKLYRQKKKPSLEKAQP